MPTNTFFNLPKSKQQRIFEAAIEEFSSTDYEHAKISTIIKQAQIPRGSFYQYFKDKFDLYQYIFNQIGQEKLHYLSDTLHNPNQVPFMVLFKELYRIGLAFAIDNPRYVKIMSLLLANKGNIFDQIMRTNMDMALNLYKDMIEKDKDRGLIRKDIDTNILAKVVYDMTVNISLDSLNTRNATFDADAMNKQIEQVISIFEKGIKIGE